MANKPKSYRGAKKSSGNNALWISVVSIIVVLGVVLIVVSRGSSDKPNSDVAPRMQTATQQGDHWHVALGVNVCGSWLPNIPQFESRAGSGNVQASIHSHGDGLIHIHPFYPDEAGENATIGRFFRNAGVTVSDSRVKWTDGTEKSAGDKCGDKPGVIRWTLFNNDADDKTPKIQSGDINDYKPEADDVVTVFFGPESDDIVKLTKDNPALPNLPNPSDVAPSEPPPSVPASTPASVPPSSTAPSSTPEPAPSSTAPASSTSAP